MNNENRNKIICWECNDWKWLQVYYQYNDKVEYDDTRQVNTNLMKNHQNAEMRNRIEYRFIIMRCKLSNDFGGIQFTIR